MPKFKFKSAKKDKFNFLCDRDEILSSEIMGIHTEIFSNKKIIIEGCRNIIDYHESFIKIKLKKGYLSIFGTEFLITTFDNEKITIKGKVTSIEFCI